MNVVISFNIRSIKKNFNEFQITLHRIKTEFNVIILTEYWLDSDHDWNNLPGYAAYHSIRGDRGGSGVTVLISTDIQSELVTELSFIIELVEVCSVKLSFGNKLYLIVGVYRAPAGPYSIFNADFSQLLEAPIVARCNTLSAGDFNIDMCYTPYPTNTHDFVNEMRAAHFLPLITIPTRVTSHSAINIDHILFNFNVPYASGAIVSSIIDHYPTFAVLLNVYISSTSKIKFQFRDHCEANQFKFSEKVYKFCNYFGYLESDYINTVCNQFCQKLNDLYDSCFPIKVKFVSQRRLDAPWLTNALLKSIDQKHRLFRLSRINNVYIDEYKEHLS